MVRTGRSEAAEGQQSLGDLVAAATRDLSSLVRYEISLAKSELKMDVRRLAIVAAIAVIALFGLCLIVVLLCFAFAYGLEAAGMPGGLWAAFLVVAFVCLVLIIVGGLIAYLTVRRVTGMKMTRQTVIDDLSMLRKSDQGTDGASAGTGAKIGAGTAAEITPAKA